MEKTVLYDEYKLVERHENEVNGAWRGAHLLVFFLAFVFGSFCTFCFHMLIYMFDENCVLFPKILSLTSHRHSVIYEFVPSDKEQVDMLPVDFLSTQWSEQATCHLPTYVPLVSGIFGLVWTTMFLMSSSGSRHLTGLQRQWRVLPTVFLFSVAMAGLCIYASSITYSGLMQLCEKLGEITGSTTCSYTVNVATLAYERRIRGVYQAIRLTILSAWLHTSCWLVSILLSVLRVLLSVDFKLIRVRVEIRGDINSIMENEDKLITNKDRHETDGRKQKVAMQAELPSLNKLTLYQAYGEDKKFIIDILYGLVNAIHLRYNVSTMNDLNRGDSRLNRIIRAIKSRHTKRKSRRSRSDEAVLAITDLVEDTRENDIEPPSTHLIHKSSKTLHGTLSETNLTEEMKAVLERNKGKQLNIDASDDAIQPKSTTKDLTKDVNDQTDITTSDDPDESEKINSNKKKTKREKSKSLTRNKSSKETQTRFKKEKQD